MGLFSGVNEAKEFISGVYFDPGAYVVRLDACKGGKTRKGITFFVAETTILHSNNAARPVGTRCSWMATLDKDAALPNIRKFCAIASDSAFSEVDEAAVDAIVSEANPLEGVILRVMASATKTKAGNPFTLVEFELLKGEEADKWAAQAAA